MYKCRGVACRARGGGGGGGGGEGGWEDYGFSYFNFQTKQDPRVSVSNFGDTAFYWCLRNYTDQKLHDFYSVGYSFWTAPSRFF